MGSMYRQHGYGTNAQEVQLQHGSPTAIRTVSQVPSPVTWVDILDRETGGAAFPKVADPTVWFNPQATLGCGFVSHLESPPRSGTNRDCLIGQVACIFRLFPPSCRKAKNLRAGRDTATPGARSRTSLDFHLKSGRAQCLHSAQRSPPHLHIVSASSPFDAGYSSSTTFHTYMLDGNFPRIRHSFLSDKYARYYMMVSFYYRHAP